MKIFSQRARMLVAIGGVIIVIAATLTGVWLATQRHAVSSVQSTPSSSPPQSLDMNTFVTRSGAQLMLDSKPFRFAGANIYWLGLDENVGGVNYPTPFRVDDALTTAEAMGATVVRAHTLGISVGCKLCVEPSLGVFNETALQHIDYAIKEAHNHHIRLIIPLVDNWHYYHGGKHTFTDWRNLPVEDEFYTDPTVISDFEQYIQHLLDHVNTYTGIAYKNDPTIMAWETGNEISPPTAWTEKIATFIKSIDSHHLVMDGSQSLDLNALSLPNVDLYTTHFYPITISLFQEDAQIVARRHKVYIVGEYDWSGTHGGDALSAFLPAIEHSTTAGDLYWSLLPHNDTYGFVGHNDGYTLHYPGDTTDMRTRVQLLVAHAYRMRGIAPVPLPAPIAPLITSISGNRIAWRGAALAVAYSVERSTSGASGPWIVICNKCATDNDTPWLDSSVPTGNVWYRVRGYNQTGAAGPYSPVYQK